MTAFAVKLSLSLSASLFCPFSATLSKYRLMPLLIAPLIEFHSILFACSVHVAFISMLSSFLTMCLHVEIAGGQLPEGAGVDGQ